MVMEKLQRMLQKNSIKFKNIVIILDLLGSHSKVCAGDIFIDKLLMKKKIFNFKIFDKNLLRNLEDSL